MQYTPRNSNLIGTTNRSGKKFYRYVLPNQWHLEVDKNGVIFSLTGTDFPNYSENVEHTRKAIGWEEYIGPPWEPESNRTELHVMEASKFTNIQTYMVWQYCKGNPQVDLGSFSGFIQSCSDIYRDSILFPDEQWLENQLDAVDWTQLFACFE